MELLQKAATPLIALILLIGVIVLIALGQGVPDQLWAALALVFGFFFGKQ